MSVTVRTASAVAFLGLLGLTGCAAGVKDGSPDGAGGTGQVSGSAKTTGPVGGAQPGSEDCFTGDYTITTITGRQSVDVQGTPTTVAGTVSGLTLSLTRAGAWTLTGTNGKAQFSAAGYTVTGTINGQAQGSYARSGTQYVFEQRGATGTVVLSVPVAGEQRVPMESVGQALAPGGRATVTCAGDRVTLDSESAKVELTRTGGGTDATGATGAPAPAGALVYNDSAGTATLACGGRAAVINGSANHLTLTGTCASLTVNGSASTIEVDSVATVTVNGHDVVVVYAGSKPAVHDNGARNHIEQR
jgi:hypothetical protein